MIYLKWNSFSILFLVTFTLSAQSPDKKLYRFTYDELHNLYFANTDKPKLQLKYAETYLQKANAENINIRRAKAYYQFAILYYNKDHKKSIRYLDSVIKYSQNSGDKFFPAAAYCEKADLLRSNFKYKEAMANYKLAEKSALENNIDYYYVVREYIAIAKSEDLEEYQEALEIYKECYNYYMKTDYRVGKYAKDFQNVVFGIADCFKSLQNTDSTSYYNQLGLRESVITKNEHYKYLFILNEGANQVLKKNYNQALDSINKALPKMIQYNDTGNILASYYYMGKSYSGLGKKEKAAASFIKVDSIYRTTKEISSEFLGGYPYLINYYKNTGDKENQLKYITSYMQIDSTLQKNYRELNKLLNKEYDTPRLLSEKENLIASLKRDKENTYWGFGILLIIALCLGTFGIYQFRTRKLYRARFEKIIKEEKNNENTENKTDNKSITTNEINKPEDIGIVQELVNQILEKLNHFEMNREFLTPNLTVHSLSQIFETNSKYLSKIVNVYKQKSFTQYVNDLRIDYALNKLKEDNKLRKYTIHALAREFGFNNAESFSAAFYKKTGIKPTYFIKELDADTI
ncbi:MULTISPECIES: AraC family transcriptional regulator [Flavobacterium]|uniref:HTH araC/xylS-type domain-containing protein n=1 Tax=Flavobacterium ginsengisoli TaxID=871694 RepID=A0ABP7EU35_9FLAO|nr:AraC family transcriptional regulator [Flavobacterium sp. IB48]MBJ2123402.1 helix-turn-helix transcriptional regulator [Flavobacterium sp. IB48]